MVDEKTYTVHEVAELSGCTVRTLYHYDELGLVSPLRGDNNYRQYGQTEIDRLHQVLLYRECDMSLDDIKQLLDDNLFDPCEALSGHLQELLARKNRIEGLIASVEKTLASLKGETTMGNKEKFEAFKQNLVDENEKTYGVEVRERWGDDAVDASNAKMMGLTEEQYADTQELNEQISAAIVAGLAAGDPAGVDGQHAADLHRQWLCHFWKDGTYSPEAHRGLAEMYVADERFKAYYEAIAPGATEFLRDAVGIYTQR